MYPAGLINIFVNGWFFSYFELKCFGLLFYNLLSFTMSKDIERLYLLNSRSVYCFEIELLSLFASDLNTSRV